VVGSPFGDRIEMPASAVRVLDDEADLSGRACAALDLLHTPYVFGGRSPFGLDCSGLITNVCQQEDIPIARDAAQQVLAGRLVATPGYRDAMRAGDRVYFINERGKVFHAGIALSSSYFVHCAPPGVQISSLEPGDRLYSEHWQRSFFAAKRP
jgi:cell wall-associated NlpC family hydrolase